jgi:hypothetical protein
VCLSERIWENEIEVRTLFLYSLKFKKIGELSNPVWRIQKVIFNMAAQRDEKTFTRSTSKFPKNKEMMFAHLVRVPDTVSGSRITSKDCYQ